MACIWREEKSQDLATTLLKSIASHPANLHKGWIGVRLWKRQELLKQGVKHLGFILQI